MGPRMTFDSLAEEALDAACLAIQKRLGVKYGDHAAAYFSGSAKAAILAELRGYAIAEARDAGRILDDQTAMVDEMPIGG